jgi:hypothetical protein
MHLLRHPDLIGGQSEQVENLFGLGFMGDSLAAEFG